MAEFNILLVEDHREISRVLAAGLKSLPLGLKVTEILSSEEALLEFTKNEIPDLVILDVMLPGITGLVPAPRGDRRAVRPG